MLETAEKVITIQKAYNILHARFSKKDDFPPQRLIEESIRSGPFKGACIDKNKWVEMLEKYYELHGWDKDTGWLTKQGLQKLGLIEVANCLGKNGCLV